MSVSAFGALCLGTMTIVVSTTGSLWIVVVCHLPSTLTLTMVSVIVYGAKEAAIGESLAAVEIPSVVVASLGAPVPAATYRPSCPA